MKKLFCLALVLALALTFSGCQGEPPVQDKEVDAQIPPELDYANDENYVEDEDEDFDDDYDEESEIDIPRTIMPAPAGSGVDYIIDDAKFASQMDELAVYGDEFIGKSIQMIGYVMHTEEEQTNFAVVRDYKVPAHDHDEDGELIEHVDEEENEIFQTGFDCSYDGAVPSENAWVRVVGTVQPYDYVDEDGEVSEMLMLKVSKLDVIPETEGGSRLVEE